MYLFARATIIMHHKLDGLNKGNSFCSYFWELEVQDQGTSRTDVFYLHSWHADGHFLPVFSHGLLSEGVSFLISSYKDTSHIGLRLTLMTILILVPL